MRVLFCAAEIYPFAKTGGLGDMAAALPKALQKYCSIFSVMPYYGFIKDKIAPVDFMLRFRLDRDYEVRVFKKDSIYFLYEATLCDVQWPYGYENDWLRFAIFSKALAKLANLLEVDLLHLNDWHTALGAYYYGGKKIFTIHNLAYQGIFPLSIARKIAIDPALLDMEHFEFWGKVNYLKGGVALSDRVTTVSPTYAKEIQTPKFGCGLDGFMRRHANKLRGILNGIDEEVWNPATDEALFVPYDATHFEKKRENKRELLHTSKPLFIFIGRLVEQKGIHLLLPLLKSLAKMPLELFIVGEGQEEFENVIEKQNFDNIHTYRGYDETLSHRLYGAADFLLMPSLFEPCGLNQMIAARYGTVPIVNPVGGLADTVFEERKCAWGVRLKEPSDQALLEAIKRAIEMPKEEMGRFDMGCDFGIDKTAQEYFALYKELVCI